MGLGYMLATVIVDNGICAVDPPSVNRGNFADADPFRSTVYCFRLQSLYCGGSVRPSVTRTSVAVGIEPRMGRSALPDLREFVAKCREIVVRCARAVRSHSVLTHSLRGNDSTLAKTNSYSVL